MEVAWGGHEGVAGESYLLATEVWRQGFLDPQSKNNFCLLQSLQPHDSSSKNCSSPPCFCSQQDSLCPVRLLLPVTADS